MPFFKLGKTSFFSSTIKVPTPFIRISLWKTTLNLQGVSYISELCKSKESMYPKYQGWQGAEWGLIRLIILLKYDIRYSLELTIPFFRTFEYVQRELDRIPDSIPVLVVGNHCDMAHHRTVSADQVSFYCEQLVRYVLCAVNSNSVR